MDRIVLMTESYLSWNTQFMFLNTFRGPLMTYAFTVIHRYIHTIAVLVFSFQQTVVQNVIKIGVR